MPTYQFRTEGALDSPETLEVEMPDLSALKVEALQYLGELIRDDGPEFWREREAALVVSDSTGLILFRLDLIVTVAPSLQGA